MADTVFTKVDYDLGLLVKNFEFGMTLMEATE